MYLQTRSSVFWARNIGEIPRRLSTQTLIGDYTGIESHPLRLTAEKLVLWRLLPAEI